MVASECPSAGSETTIQSQASLSLYGLLPLPLPHMSVWPPACRPKKKKGRLRQATGWAEHQPCSVTNIHTFFIL